MMEVSLRFAMSGLLCLLLIATGGCSFKKDPARGKGAPVTLIEEQAQPEHVASLDEVIAGDDEEKAIEALVQRKDELAALSRGGAVSALDLAIKHGKQKVAQFLLISGQSPFVLNQESREKLSYDGPLNQLIVSAQTDSFTDILRAYPKKTYEGISPNTSMEEFKDRIIEYRLGARGCELFADFLLQRQYLRSDPIGPGLYYEVFEGLKPQEVFSSLLSETSCSAFVERFSTDMVSSWVGYEFLYQFQSSFKSIAFLKYLVNLKQEARLSITLPAGGWHSDHLGLKSSQVSVSPVSLLMLKKVCLSDVGLLDEWIKLARMITRNGAYGVSYPYFFADESEGTDVKCNEEQKYCSESYVNLRNLWSLYYFVFPNAMISETDFMTLYKGKSDIYLSPSLPKKEDYEKFRSDLCRTPERRDFK
ncbi:hypothetical protein [Bdellovibrio bacteriovorus]|uniref:Uncharacterized protein n=1 Tax=Bdellovibrio bacteriovorus str. Tiberius TaxID=1069642 RepID=K7YTA3_BDEBC|nr:hypothetical protein [Bdellovibrio bacteriovorus]AFY00858.1 hypothetical protein Bdt_1158 [Bdellovibrio bacteriovorus str. Tiberius]